MAQFISIKNIKAAFAYFRENPKGKIATGIWSDPAWTRAEFMAWFHKCLNAKINRTRLAVIGRKCSDKYQQGLRRDARIINDYARRVMWRGLKAVNYFIP